MAEIGAEQAGEGVQVPVPVGVPHVAALAAVDYDQVVTTPRVTPREVWQQVMASPLPIPHHVSLLYRASQNRVRPSPLRDYTNCVSVSNPNRRDPLIPGKAVSSVVSYLPISAR